MLDGIEKRENNFYLTTSEEAKINKVYHALLKDHPELFWVHNRQEVYTTSYQGRITVNLPRAILTQIRKSKKFSRQCRMPVRKFEV